MEKEKIITITDFGNKFKFKIRLFGVMDGLNFFDKLKNIMLFEDKSKISVKDYLDDLLPLASQLSENNEVIASGLSLNDCSVIFQSPMSVIELGAEIFRFQEVFLKDSKIYHELKGQLGGKLNTPILESTT